MSHDRDYFRRRAEEARAAASHTNGEESAEIAGHLALAYAALARRRLQQAEPPAESDPPVLLAD